MCSPEGLTFRPKVSGSITQSQLKEKLQAKLAADPTLDIDVNRALSTSDLSVSDLTAEIAIELPKVWNERFQQKASFKRVSKTNADVTETDGGTTDGSDSTNTGGTDNSTPSGGGSGSNTGGSTPSGGGTNTGGGDNTGGEGGGDNGGDENGDAN